MWLQLAFDLPVKTKIERSKAARFRNDLIDLGFSMMHLSVYIKYFSSSDKMNTVIRRIKSKMPNQGKVFFLAITDKQFENLQYYCDGKETEFRNKPSVYEYY